MKKSFLLVGANFINKGAQAMLFTAVTELRKRFVDCDIYMSSIFDYMEDNSQYRFSIIPGGNLSYKCCDNIVVYTYVKNKGRLKEFLGKNNLEKKYAQLRDILPSLTAVLDISGYALSSQWGYDNSMKYIQTLKWAEKNGIPVFLLPQSFGPFDYGDNQYTADKEIKKSLAGVECIFAREKNGKELLKKKYGLKNVVLSADMVLQCKKLTLNEIFQSMPEDIGVRISTHKNVAVIPNVRNLEHGNKEIVMKMYDAAVRTLLKLDRNVYLVAHSKEDGAICEKLKKDYSNNGRVFLVEEDLNCIQYESFVSFMDYIIGSRFHSIVHAYKEDIPCVAIGWAVKYKELLERFGQIQYAVDVRSNNAENALLEAINRMEINYTHEKAKIAESLKIIQDQNCFDVIEKILLGGSK